MFLVSLSGFLSWCLLFGAHYLGIILAKMGIGKNCLQRILLLVARACHWLEVTLAPLVAGSVWELRLPFPALALADPWLSFLGGAVTGTCLGDPAPASSVLWSSFWSCRLMAFFWKMVILM